MVEKGLLAMKALSETCNFSGEYKRLKQLVKQFVEQLESSGAQASAAEMDGKVDAEYIRHLLQLCGTLLENIHNRWHADL